MASDFDKLLNLLTNDIDNHGDAHSQRDVDRTSYNNNSKGILKGKKLFNNIKPGWAKAVILAKYEINESDLYKAFYSLKTKYLLILSWSDNTNNDFNELRDAAKKSHKTSNLAELNPSFESKESFTGGTGYSLKQVNHFETGWRVQKETFNKWTLNQLYIALANDQDLTPVSPNFIKSNKKVSMIMNAEKYSDRSFVVRGMPSEEQRTKLKNIGGRFNYGLRGGPGWIFSVKKVSDVKEILNIDIQL